MSLLLQPASVQRTDNYYIYQTDGTNGNQFKRPQGVFRRPADARRLITPPSEMSQEVSEMAYSDLSLHIANSQTADSCLHPLRHAV